MSKVLLLFSRDLVTSYPAVYIDQVLDTALYPTNNRHAKLHWHALLFLKISGMGSTPGRVPHSAI
uniref:Uncharacterized protein n=1 Tax=Timema monikensis TaxID=170555 RepID=A0A7R9E878_9NEOP|nr:unnamed protein product [Timema monikensis]